MFKYLFVGGHFGDNPKPSGYARKLFNVLHAINPNGVLHNGGKFHELTAIVTQLKTYVKYDVVFWMPDVSNKREKLLKTIKTVSPHSILIISKNNLDGKYKFIDLVARALQVKANLFVELTKTELTPHDIIAGVYDPLGNCFCISLDIDKVAVALMDRVQELLRFTRIGSKVYDWGKELESPNIPDEFYNLVRNYADVFHKCIHGVNPSRLLGNASFRCERGFPSFKDGEQVYVSRRNIDKRHIEPAGFVPVKLVFNNLKKTVNVAYQGEHKPSVDSPVQLMLYHYYRNIKYMIHSHTYIRHAPFTEQRIPCGAIEEFYEIIKVYPSSEHTFLTLNLIGHGSLVMASHVENLQVYYYPRKAPEGV